jgi:hypothetical protein
MITSDLSRFGSRELSLAADLLSAYAKGNMSNLACDYFSKDGVVLTMNQHSGFVFLTNAEYQVLMHDGDTLDLFITLPYSGEEGFLSDLMLGMGFSDYHQEDLEYLSSMKDYMNPDQRDYLEKKMVS